MTIIVFGGTGLLGKNLRQYRFDTYQGGNDWIFLGKKDCDLTKFDSVVSTLTRYKPICVINLAGYVGGLYKNIRENVKFFEENMLIGMNVIKACCECNVQKLISILSTCIYPDIVPSYPITEDMLQCGPPHTSNPGYSYSKRMIDVLTTLYNNQYNTKYITLILGNMYGPYDNFNLEDSHMIPGLIHKCILAKKNKTDFIVYGSGIPLRQFTYARDVGKIISNIVENYPDITPINVSIQNEYTIREFAEIIANKVGYTGNIIYDTTKDDGQYKKTVSTERFLSLYPETTFTDINTGISKTIDWFIINMNS